MPVIDFMPADTGILIGYLLVYANIQVDVLNGCAF